MVQVWGCEKQQAAPAQPSESAGAAPGAVVESPGVPPIESEPPPSEPEPGSGRTEIVATDVACTSDDDCVKASCCHATTCVARADAPDCAGAMCTADCRGGTMDCNGGCLCQAGKCAAKIWYPPSG
jgi:hypothetical protein